MSLRLLKATILLQSRQVIRLHLNTNAKLNSRLQSTSSVTKTKFTGTRTWRGIVKGFVPVGLCLIAVMQWRAYRKYAREQVASHWEISLYCSLPLRTISRAWGWIAEKRVPEAMRPWIYGFYSSTFHVNLEEAISSDFKDYVSLAEFFARPLKNGARPIDPNCCLSSPCDGTVLNLGPVDTCQVEQVKGVTYSLEEFLTGETKKTRGEQFRKSLLADGENNRLYQCVLYLAPGDYHRFHSPADWRAEKRLHFAGRLLSVSPRIARFVPGLFTLNERAVYTGQWKHGFFSFTPVGATNVGSVRVYFDQGLRTNVPGFVKRTPPHIRILNDVYLHKGDIVGEFRMGSTIVLIFEAPHNFQFNLKAGQRVHTGQAIGYVTTDEKHDNVSNNNV